MGQTLARPWRDDLDGLPHEAVDTLVQRTPFSEQEIAHLYNKYKVLDENGDAKLNLEELKSMDELRANPFADRICSLFSQDGSGTLAFVDFVEMMAVFSYRTPAEIKLIWAFAIWDFDGDNMISAGDIKVGLDLIVNYQDPFSRAMGARGINEEMSPQELDEVAAKVLAEIDPDGLGVNYTDFRSVLTRMPDFLFNFRMSI
mmetsp:Transcript_7427/g.14025  ORF Transcript_7427/g.14025 Transcript_7427/m.14025 type:complete len:201 (-) Transcript_7427:73-675(-)